MPHLTVQVSPGGPVLDIRVGVSLARRQALLQSGQLVPNPVQIRALVDTGASCTCVDPQILQALTLSPRGITPMLTPSTGAAPHPANVYDVSLVLMHPNLSLTLGNVAVAESHLSVQGIQALIGRDVPRRCLFVYDGQTGIFTLAF
jgi:predicted aspartyl protease